MHAQGTLYMSRTAPLATTAADGTFELTLLLMDRIAPLRVEPWRVTWAGHEARAWWQANQGALQAGRALSVQVTDVRAHQGGRWAAPETHARVLGCALLPQAAAPRTAQRATEQD